MANGELAFPQAPGFHDTQFTTAVGTMDLSLVLPANVAATTPLILVLHYAGQPTRYYGRPLLENLLVPAFSGVKDEFDPIFVAPTSLGGDWREENNITAVFEALSALESHYGTNQSRRVVTGYSMGAVGSWHIQSLRPDYFAAAIPIAGYPRRSSVDCKAPIYAIMSDKDEIFPLPPFQDLIEELQQKNCTVLSETISGIGHYDIGGFQSALGNAAAWLAKLWRATPAHQ